MSRVTLKVDIKPEPGANKEHVLRIRVTKDRIPRYWALNISVPKSSFNKAGTLKLRNWIKTNHSEHAVYNDRIYKQYKKAEKAIEEFESDDDRVFTSSDIINYLKQGGKSDTLLDFFNKHLAKRYELAGTSLQKFRTAKNYELTLNRLTEYLTATKQTALPMRLLTRAVVLEYRAWLLERYAHNTVSTTLGCLRHVTLQAVEAGLILKYPFKKVPITYKDKPVQRLNDAELDKLAEAPRQTTRGHRSVTDRKHARPSAMLIYYFQGIRLSDFVLMRRESYSEQDGEARVKYEMNKTGKFRDVLLPPEAVELIQPYLIHEDGTPKKPKEFLFPYVIKTLDKLVPTDQYKYIHRATTRLSFQLKSLAKQIGLEKKLTPHILRHSFADLLRRNKVDIITIQMTMGHSDLKTTRRYMDAFDKGAVDSVVSLYKSRKTVGKQISQNNNSTDIGDNKDNPILTSESDE